VRAATNHLADPSSKKKNDFSEPTPPDIADLRIIKRPKKHLYKLLEPLKSGSEAKIRRVNQFSRKKKPSLNWQDITGNLKIGKT